MNKIKSFLDRKIVTKDVGEETYITWREALSYAMGKLLAYTVNVTSQCEKEQHIKYLEEYNRKIIEALP